MIDIIVGGVQYVATGKLDAFTQLHLARKLGPAMPIVSGLVRKDNEGKDKALLTVLMLSHIPDADAEYVIRKCLSVVSRRQEGGKLARLQAADGSLMFDDIGLPELLELSVVIIEDNLGTFFRTALSNMAELGAAQA